MMRPIPLLLRFPLRLGPARANSLVLELLSRLCSSLSYARSDGLFRLAAWYASPGDPSQGCSASVMGFLFARLTSVWPGVPRCLSAPHVDSDVLHDRSSSCDFFTIAKDLEPPGQSIYRSLSAVHTHRATSRSVSTPPTFHMD
eukprot:GHVT01013846.1.p1 GENE.GHVT01013846.1~~GHVT01013846.1.p1  ORF type:complete len:143 (-),score=3.21 GHVT01013846.1:1-429(-)